MKLWRELRDLPLRERFRWWWAYRNGACVQPYRTGKGFRPMRVPSWEEGLDD